jgi:hypothetical protein
LERQAFEAHMRINNGTDLKLEIVAVDVLFTDGEGKPVVITSDTNPSNPASFFIRLDKNSCTNVSNLQTSSVVGEGYKITSGNVNAKLSGDLYWLIIPAADSSRQRSVGTLYYAGAIIEYRLQGETESTIVKVAPDNITVKPLPQIKLDYFCPGGVAGKIPFPLGVRVSNIGKGIAWDLQIKSAQPVITENNQGLLIDFALLGSMVQDQPVNNSLLVNFGSLKPNTSKQAYWLMMATLAGQFNEFSATVSHSDELGGELTALIKQQHVNTHKLIGVVKSDRPGSADSIIDYLAIENGFSNAPTGLKVFESTAGTYEVINLSDQVSQSGPENLQTLTVSGLSQAVNHYFFAQFEQAINDKQVKNAMRSDGKYMLPGNVWFNPVYDDNGGVNYHLCVFDFNTIGGDQINYTVYLEDSQAINVHAPRITRIIDFSDNAAGVEIYNDSNSTEKTIVKKALSIEEPSQKTIKLEVWAADDDNDSLKFYGLALPAGAVFQQDGFMAKAVFTWTALAGQEGSYDMYVKVADGSKQAVKGIHLQVFAKTDQDGDGLDDSWEEDNDLDDPDGDADGDGISNKDEHDNGLDPNSFDNAPAVPTIIEPAVNAVVNTKTPSLRIANSHYTGGNQISYDIEIYDNVFLHGSAVCLVNVAETPSETAYTLTPDQALKENHRYFWRVRCLDRMTNSEKEMNYLKYSQWAYGEFTVNTEDDGCGELMINQPVPGAVVNSLQPELSVLNALNPDPQLLQYQFEIHSDAGFNSQVAVSNLIPESGQKIICWKPDFPLHHQQTYFWRAFALKGGTVCREMTGGRFIVDMTAEIPPAPLMLFPENKGTIRETKTLLSVTSDPGVVFYQFELDRLFGFNSPDKKQSGFIPAGTDTTSWLATELSDNTAYFWRVRAVTENVYSDWHYGTFTVSTINDNPWVPTVKNPGNHSWVRALNPILEVIPSYDADGDVLDYVFELYADIDMKNLVFAEKNKSGVFPVKETVLTKLRYYWRVRAEDSHGAVSLWSDLQTFVCYRNFYFQFIAPAAAQSVTDNALAIKWQDDDLGNGGRIALYYSPDFSNRSSLLIVNNLDKDADGAGDEYSWDLSTVPDGTWYISAKVTRPPAQGILCETHCPYAITIDRHAPQVISSPAGGNYPQALQVTLSINEPGIIYYTLATDAQLPVNLYTGPVSVNNSAVLSFYGVDLLGNQSTVYNENYQIGSAQAVRLHMQTDRGRNLPDVSVVPCDMAGNFTTIQAGKTNIQGEAVFSAAEFIPQTPYRFSGLYLGYAFLSSQAAAVQLPEKADTRLTIPVELVRFKVVNTDQSGQTKPARVMVDVHKPNGDYVGLSAGTDETGNVIFELPVGCAYKFVYRYLNLYHRESEVFTVESGGANFYQAAVNCGKVTFRLNKELISRKQADWAKTDVVQKPLAAVMVDICQRPGFPANYQQQSDVNGEISYYLPVGNYQLIAYMFGYTFYSQPVAIEADDVSMEWNIPFISKKFAVKSSYADETRLLDHQQVILRTIPGHKEELIKRITDAAGIVAMELPQDKLFYLESTYYKKCLGIHVNDQPEQDLLFFLGQADVQITLADQSLPGVVVEAVIADRQNDAVERSHTDADGKVIFRLPANEYLFRVHYLQQQIHSSGITLTADASVPVSVSLGNQVFSYTVKTDSGVPLAGIFCHVKTSSGQYLLQTQITDSTGQARFLLPDGSYCIKAVYLGSNYLSSIYEIPAVTAAELIIPHTLRQVAVRGDFNGQTENLDKAAVTVLNDMQQPVLPVVFTDESGLAALSLPKKDFAYAVCYRGNTHITELSQQGLENVLFALGKVQVKTSYAEEPLPNQEIVLLSADGSDTGVRQISDWQGISVFTLPQAVVRFKTDQQTAGNLPQTFYSNPLSVVTHQQKDLELSTGGLNFSVLVQKSGANPLANVKCYLYDHQEQPLAQLAVTNSSGEAQFNLSSGRFMIRADYLGYSYWLSDILSPEQNSRTLEIAHQINSVQISSTHPDVFVNGILRPIFVYTEGGSDLLLESLSDANGLVQFELPQHHPYKFKTTVLGQPFFSSYDNDSGLHLLHIASGKAVIRVQCVPGNAGQAGLTVGLYSSGNEPLGQTVITDHEGNAAFILPVGLYRFRTLANNQALWTGVATVQAGQETVMTIDVEIP